MKVSIYLSFCLLFLSISSCDTGKSEHQTDKKDPPAIQVNPNSDVESASENDPAANKTSPKVNVLSSSRGITRYYTSCTVYAGATDYYFSTEDGEQMEIRVSNIPEERKIKVPGNLQESGENIEGPPGPNPEMVGKPFRILYNAADEVIAIEGPVDLGGGD